MKKVAIIGTGLIGTSLGLAIKQALPKDVRIVGTDIERSHASKAQKVGAVDQVSGSLAGAVENAQMVVIATPVVAMKDIMEVVGSNLMEGCLVTDTGDSKTIVTEWAERYLPRNVSFVGGHPMVSKDGAGPDAADGSLFNDRPYCIIPGRGAQRDAVRLLTDIIKAIGAKPYFMDVGEHDSFVSAVTQLPVLLSVALVGCTSKSPSWDDIAKVASTRYRELSSLASGNPDAGRDLFYSDHEGLVHWIDAFIHELYEIRQILTTDPDGRQEALNKVFSQALDARARWMAGLVTPESQAASNMERIPSASEGLTSLFVGHSESRRRILGWGDKPNKDNRGRK